MAINWPENSWYVAAFSREVAAVLLPRKILGKPVVMYRTSAGEVVALADQCAHRMLPLSFGTLRGDNLVCGYHGMTFAPSGKCIAIPGQEQVPPTACVKSYSIAERHDLIWIWMGNAELADPDQIPDVGRMKREGWVPSEGYSHINADYRLLIDNLLDLSHVAFVHGRTIGNLAVAESPINVSQRGNVVSVHRDVIGAMAPPFYEQLGRFKGPIHRWHTVNYHPPSICAIEVGCKALEEADGLGEIVGVVLHLVTPETEDSTHYFWAFVRNFRQDEPALTAWVRDQITATHHEDKVVVELQHGALRPEQRDNPIALAIGVDGGPIRGRRVLQQAIDESAKAESRTLPAVAALAGSVANVSQ